MGAPQGGDSASDDAKQLHSAAAKGLSADCIFQAWPRDRQMAAYRQLSQLQETTTDNVPGLVLSIDNSGSHLVRKDGQREPGCPVPKTAVERLPKVHLTDRPSQPSSYETERLDHPERIATKIEDTALLALRGNEQSRLDLREQLDSLMHEPKAYREKVLGKMEEDGAYGLTKLTSDRPHAVVARDSSGASISIELSKNLGIDKMTIPLNKSVAGQVDDAQKAYVQGLQQIVGGLGKFSPDGTMKAMDILDGSEPSTLRWFMLYRKQQGRPAVDLQE